MNCRVPDIVSTGMNTTIETNTTLQRLALPSFSQGLISDEVIQYIYTINVAIVCAALCLCGIVTNVINIIVFSGMGFKETINIALLGLSISDLCSLIPLLWLTICLNPLFMYSDVPIDTIQIQHKTGGWTHFVFNRVTAFITLFITLERCLCIAFPLKIKAILTPKRTVGIIISIYLIIVGSLSVNYSNVKYVWKFITSENRTILGQEFKDNREIVQLFAYVLNVFYILVSFISVIICSIILVWKLIQRSKFLKSATTTDNDNSRKLRDRQVIKMVVCVAGIFIISFTPSVLTLSAMSVELNLNIGKKYENLFMTLLSICYIFDALNSSVNILIYYNMSSNYAKQLSSIFRLSKK